MAAEQLSLSHGDVLEEMKHRLPDIPTGDFRGKLRYYPDYCLKERKGRFSVCPMTMGVAMQARAACQRRVRENLRVGIAMHRLSFVLNVRRKWRFDF
jgi:hypothetical protein